MEQKLPYRLVVFDLDNTALYHGAMSRETRRTLRELRKMGVITAAATGRHISIIPPVVRRKRYVDFILCVNGSSIYDAKTRSMTHLCQMPNELALFAIDACKRSGGCMNLTNRDHAMAEKSAFQSFLKSPAVSGKSRRKLSLNGIQQLVQVLLASEMIEDAGLYLKAHPRAIVQKLDVFFEREANTIAAVSLLNETDCFEVAQSAKYLEITEKGCSKGNAIVRLCEMLGVATRDVVAFGDSGNDLSMAQVVGLFVAMGNAEEAVLQRADLIAPDVQQDGFAVVANEIFGRAKPAR